MLQMIAMKYYLNTFKAESQFIVSVCDEDLLGKCFREGQKILDLNTHSKFYKGTKMDIDEVKSTIKDASVLNLVGENIIKEAIKNSWCEKENILYIAGIPHIQIYKVNL